ncbi:MAG: hypothetical protein ACK4VN_05480 [Bacteroidales bacterium]|mgnify:CR=1 FL=1
MASIKDLKRDINFLMEEVIETCFLHYHFKADQKDKLQEIDQIIEDIITTRNSLMEKINNPDPSIGKGAAKKYFNGLLDQMMQKADEAFERLGAVQQ